MSISIVFVTFLFQLAVGMTATIVLLPPSVIDNRFFKSISFWAFLFAAIGIFVAAKTGLPLAGTKQYLLYGFTVLAFGHWLVLRFTERPASRLTLALMAGIGIAALLLNLHYSPDGTRPTGWVRFLFPLHELSGSLLLGGYLTGMMFGHHYLVNTEMPKRLLVTMADILMLFLGIRALAVGATLVGASHLQPGLDLTASLLSLSGHGIFFWERVLVGLFIPAIVAVMVWKTARLGSNQSATGIMYVAVAFVFMGELVARYLYLLSGIPL